MGLVRSLQMAFPLVFRLPVHYLRGVPEDHLALCLLENARYPFLHPDMLFYSLIILVVNIVTLIPYNMAMYLVYTQKMPFF